MGASPELGPSSLCAAEPHCHGRALEPVVRRLCLPATASKLFMLYMREKVRVMDVMRSDCAGCKVGGLALPVWGQI